MEKRKIEKNYEFYSNYDFFVPDPHGVLMLILWFIAGALLGNVISIPIMLLLGSNPLAQEYAMLVAYPLMFIPAMIYASYKSRENSFFGKGFKLSNHHYLPLGLGICIPLVMLVTIATSFLADSVIALLPPMPDWLSDILSDMTQSNFLINFLSVCIFAPFFEEWLCRGMILRGLLNYERKGKDGEKVRGMKPVWAIVISAAIFAIIHANPWQAIAAFSLGVLFGYVYYRTGSIWLTMLMHFTNNFFALVLSNIEGLAEMEGFKDVLPGGLYWAVLVFCAAFIVYFVYKFLAIKPLDKQGSCAELVSE